MIMDELKAQYAKDFQRSCSEYDAWRTQQIAWARGAKVEGENKPYDGFSIDYVSYEKQIGDIIQKAFTLSDSQRGYVMAATHFRFHSAFGDMFDGAVEIADLLVNFPRN